ncbi:MAG: DUF3443 family protein [Gammaproteobacteria bacterium]|nr:DUF3443 family protein [Gammaproteobacteria bacterium]
MRPALAAAALAVSLAACVGSKSPPGSSTPPPVVNVVPLGVDTGPAAASGRINHAYVSVKVCAAGSTSQCATIDHVLLDTGSTGLRLVRSVLTAAGLNLGSTTDAQGNAIEECMTFGGGQTWGPVAAVDLSMGGESAAKLPIQILDDTAAGAPAPSNCGANGTLLNDVASFGANGLLGVGVFQQDCGPNCVNPTTPLPIYYGCTTAGVCTAENLALGAQVSNPVASFKSDNNGVIVQLPNPANANGDPSLAGQLIFGLGTQSDNALPATGLVILDTDAQGEFSTVYNGGTTSLPAVIDSGSDAYEFNDPTITQCTAGNFIGFYCPPVAPLSLSATNTGAGSGGSPDTVNFAIEDPNTFVAGAAALPGLAEGLGATTFTWGLPFFFGRSIYVGIEQHAAGAYNGPFFGY